VPCEQPEREAEKVVDDVLQVAGAQQPGHGVLRRLDPEGQRGRGHR
jgi:hypothetical protein